jgi:hypothetical protein
MKRIVPKKFLFLMSTTIFSVGAVFAMTRHVLGSGNCYDIGNQNFCSPTQSCSCPTPPQTCAMEIGIIGYPVINVQISGNVYTSTSYDKSKKEDCYSAYVCQDDPAHMCSATVHNCMPNNATISPPVPTWQVTGNGQCQN